MQVLERLLSDLEDRAEEGGFLASVANLVTPEKIFQLVA